MSDYVNKVLRDFIAETEGTEIDLTGAFGPQSPDLIIAYIQALTGSGWRFEYPYAVDLWEDARGSMVDFERVQRNEPLQRGDILVFDGTNGAGTLGIYVEAGSEYLPGLNMFTQNPGPARTIFVNPDSPYQRLLGAWRLTAGAECKAIATEYAKQVGPFVTWSPGDGAEYGQTRRQQVRSFLARLADSVRGQK